MSRGQRNIAGLDLSLPLVLILSAAAALPLLGPYFVGSHDGILAVYRFFQFDRSIQDGILMPRWAPDLFFGYGYPFFNFYAPLSYYVAEVFHTAGLGFVGSISATFALGFVLSGIFMYLFVRDLAGRWAGLLAALAYVFAPYHLVNAHLRGDLAEFFAFVWFPAILWAAGRLMSRGNLGYLALTSLFYGALLITHNIMALAFSALLAGYIVFLLVANRWGFSPPTTPQKLEELGGTPPNPPGLPAVNDEDGGQPHPHGLPAQNEVGGHPHPTGLLAQEDEQGGSPLAHGLPAQGDETGSRSG
ncbi:MAG: 6-pyruvoyl-tetrahydropterin synthase-related protein, partial [Chloroflexota bacterium]|nr:6-pyruvoyl-tetrahydropterin synthase-related protein [Chloroflexota bacterium]